MYDEVADEVYLWWMIRWLMKQDDVYDWVYN